MDIPLEALKIKHANELWELIRKFKIEEMTHQANIDVKEATHFTFDVLDRMRKDGYIQNIINLLEERVNEPLYFEFGKYKNRIVQDIVNEDPEYCKWFVNSIRGEDLNTLKICNYLFHIGQCRKFYVNNIYDEGIKLFTELFSCEMFESEKEDIHEFLHRLRTYGEADNCVYDNNDIGLLG